MDPFDVLQVDPDADDAEVHRAYRRRVKETHPDQGGSATEFQRVRRAYERILAGEASAVDAGANGEADAEAPDPEPCRVEYLDYAVLDDYGWSLDDDDLFERAAAAGLDPAEYGEILVEPDESLLQAAEKCGFAWPYACRGGACANCAVAVVDGEMSVPTGHILPSEMIDRGLRLSCISAPTTAEARVVYDVKHMPDLDELRLPPDRFERKRSTG